VAMNVYDGTMTSPVISSARTAISRATVALHIATQCLVCAIDATLASNSLTKGIIGEPATVKHVVEPRKKPLSTSHIRSAHMQYGLETGRSSQYRERFGLDCRICLHLLSATPFHQRVLQSCSS